MTTQRRVVIEVLKVFTVEAHYHWSQENYAFITVITQVMVVLLISCTSENPE